MDAKELPGPLKAAILIQSLGPNIAKEILGMLEEPEKKVIESHMTQLGSIAPDLRSKIAGEFIDRLFQARAGSGTSALPRPSESEAPEVPELPGLRGLESQSPEELVRIIRDEHPQTIAVILSHLTPDKAANTLAGLPDKIKTDVAMRIASANTYAAEMIEEVQSVFEQILQKKKTSGSINAGGVGCLAEMLNLADKSISQAILGEIEEKNAVLAAEIKQMMFVFDDIVLVDDRGFQQVLRRVDTRDMAIALKAASEEIRAKVFKNMSERAGAMLREEMESMGPVKMKEVEGAQQMILGIIQEMEAEGSVVVSRGGRDEFVE